MTIDLFFAWLGRFYQYIALTPGRKITLLIDNCSAHGFEEKMPVFSNIRIEFLPPNAISMVQPLDAGIIAWVKRRYKRRLLFCIFENIEAGQKSIYNVDVLTAIRWTYEEWNACPHEVIRNCFTHCFKQSEGSSLGKENDGDQECINNMQRDAT